MHKVLDAFADLRTEETAEGIYDDCFYTIIQKPPPRAIIRKGVREWIEHLRGQPQCSKFLLDFLGLILGHLLTTEPKDRISSDELDRKISEILQRVQIDPHYSEPFDKPKRLSLPSSGDRRSSSILNIESLGEESELKKESGYRSEQEATSQGENSKEEEGGASQVDDSDNSQDRNQDNGSNRTSWLSPLSTSSGIAAKGDLPSPPTDSTNPKPKKIITFMSNRHLMLEGLYGKSLDGNMPSYKENEIVPARVLECSSIKAEVKHGRKRILRYGYDVRECV